MHLLHRIRRVFGDVMHWVHLLRRFAARALLRTLALPPHRAKKAHERPKAFHGLVVQTPACERAYTHSVRGASNSMSASPVGETGMAIMRTDSIIRSMFVSWNGVREPRVSQAETSSGSRIAGI